MASERSRAGSFYAVLIVGAVTLIGLVAGLQLQMDQQVARARRLKSGAEALLLARRGIDAAARELQRTGSLAGRTASTPEGGELVVVAEGPRPPGSRTYVVFARGRYAGAPVTMVADMRPGATAAEVGNREVLYHELDVDSAPARATIIAGRRDALQALTRAISRYRGDGSGLSGRLSAFLAGAASGRIPAGDRARVVSTLASALTTDVP